MAKKKKSKKGKVAGGVGILAIIAALGLFGGKGLGLGNGSGLGLGVGNDTSVNSDGEKQQEEKDPVENPQETEKENNKTTISIEVKKDLYLIDGEEKSLTDIEALLTGNNGADTSFVLVDNYAATKAWDEVKALFTEYEIDVVEQ